MGQFSITYYFILFAKLFILIFYLQNYFTQVYYWVLQVCVKAKYPYKAKRNDELTFPKHAIIQNVNKVEENWWRGDYGGTQQHWFPAAFVNEIEAQPTDDKVHKNTFNFILLN